MTMMVMMQKCAENVIHEMTAQLCVNMVVCLLHPNILERPFHVLPVDLVRTSFSAAQQRSTRLRDTFD